jgi:hypothetical protein
VIAASREIDGPLRGKAQELAGMLLKVRLGVRWWRRGGGLATCPHGIGFNPIQ